jgi:beta-D-xylosidase 4
LEEWDGVDRHHFNAVVSPQDVADYYLVPFEACVLDGKAESIMCSYNEVNGVPSCGNSYYLQTLLRQEMRFDGYVVSDCDAIEDIYDQHFYTKTGEQATALGLQSGTDLDCGGTYSTFAAKALSEGILNEATIDLALRRHFVGLIRLGYFDAPEEQVFRQYGSEDVNTEHAQMLALDAARRSAVLLKNDKNVLPLPNATADAPISIALIGPSVNVSTFLLGNYFGVPPYIINPLDAWQNTSYTINYVYGCGIDSNNKDGFADAINAAKNSDYIIYMGGLDQNQEAEGHDRTNITWPGVQEDLITELSGLGKPFILVVLSGGQIDLRKQRDSPDVHSIVWFGYPGQAGGWAIVDVLTGVYGPAGKLPVTQYPGEYAMDISMFDMRLPSNGRYPGRTHRWYTGEAIYPFGHGLTYSSFSWDVNSEYPNGLSSTLMNDTSGIPTFAIADIINYVKLYDPLRPDRVLLPITWHITVKNTGSVESDIVTLAYISNFDAPFQVPLRQLWSYSRHIRVAPGETRYSDFSLNVHELSSVDYSGNRYLTPGTYELFLNNERHVSVKIQLTGQAQQFYSIPMDPNSSTAKVSQL